MNRIILADDQKIFRAGVARVLSLEGDMQIVAQCDGYAQLLTKVESFRGAIIIVSFTMLIDPDALLGRIESSDSRVILIFGNGDEVPHGIASHVDGMIPRAISRANLVSCVRRVSQGQRSCLRGKIPSLEVPDSASVRARKSLTPREMQVVALIGQGCKNKHIAAQLNIKEQVIKNHLRSIYDKVGVSDRVELAIFALRQPSLAEAAVTVVHRLQESTSRKIIVEVPDTTGMRACNSLSRREMQIVALIAQGSHNKHIANQLDTTEQSIKNHLRSIFVKIGVSDRLELAVFTFRHRTLAEAAAKVGDLLQERASSMSPSLQETRQSAPA